MANAPKSDLPVKLTNKNRAAWIKLAQNYRAKHGSLLGFTDKHGFGYWPNKDGNFTLYRPDPDSTVKGGVKPKSYYGRLDSRTKNRIKRDNLALAQTFGEDTFPKPTDGKQVHHKRKLSQYAPFFEGATLEEAHELARYAAEDLKAPLGNRLENAELIDPGPHSRHHNWERRMGYTPGKFTALTKEGPFPSDFSSSDLETRKYALNRFLLNEQPRIDANLERVQFKPAPNGDLHLPTLRNAARGLAVGGVAALGPLGTAASASETAIRTKIANKTKNPLDQFQAMLSGFSLGADALSYAPPATIPATIASTAADVVNAGIDTGRDIYNSLLGK